MIVAIAKLGLPVLIDGPRLSGTVNCTSNISFDSSILSSTTGNITEDICEPAVNVAIKGLDTKSTPPP